MPTHSKELPLQREVRYCVFQMFLLKLPLYPDVAQGAKDGIRQRDFQKYFDERLAELNKELPNYAKLKKIEILSEDFERTPKKSIKRYLYQRS